MKCPTGSRFFVPMVDRYGPVSAPQNQKSGSGAALIAFGTGFSGVSQAFLPVFDPKSPILRPTRPPLQHPTCGPTAVERRTARICIGPDRGRGRAGHGFKNKPCGSPYGGSECAGILPASNLFLKKQMRFTIESTLSRAAP